MEDRSRADLTQLLLRVRAAGSERESVNDRLYEAVYGELRRVAGAIMSTESPAHTLQPTALVHEAYLKLIDQDRIERQDRAHFFGVATRAMRQILVDHARRRHAAKRGGDRQRVMMDEALAAEPDQALEIVELDDAIQKLGQLSERMARVVEFRIFGGMSHGEIA